MLYVLPGIQLNSSCRIPDFDDFVGNDEGKPTVYLQVIQEAFSPKKIIHTFDHTDINVAVLEEDWLYTLSEDSDYQLLVSSDYKKMTAYITAPYIHYQKLQPLLRSALECASAYRGIISLHSACVEVEGYGVCFTAPSGVGKSTRARSWEKAFGAKMISGDRPQIKKCENGYYACGVPWDGKECIHMNVSVPLLAICRVVRSSHTKIRKLSVTQARRVLMQQCFIPMWDTDTSMRIMELITILCRKMSVYMVFCGPDEKAAQEVRNLLCLNQDNILEEEKDMKIKSSFILREVAGEYLVVPTGENIEIFDGAIVLNEISAFVWKKLENGTSRDELLADILDEYDVEQNIAEQDLDDLLDRMRSYGVLE